MTQMQMIIHRVDVLALLHKPFSLIRHPRHHGRQSSSVNRTEDRKCCDRLDPRPLRWWSPRMRLGVRSQHPPPQSHPLGIYPSPTLNLRECNPFGMLEVAIRVHEQARGRFSDCITWPLPVFVHSMRIPPISTTGWSINVPRALPIMSWRCMSVSRC